MFLGNPLYHGALLGTVKQILDYKNVKMSHIITLVTFVPYS
jgi:hypothetical protein